MKREIKFRVWDDRVTRYIANPEDVRLNVGTGEAHGKLSSGNVDHWLLEQYTGLKDKNGVEIYANDYCRKPDGTIIFIAWNNYGFKVISVEIVDGKKLRIPLGNLGNYLSSNCEIIGNIHE